MSADHIGINYTTVTVALAVTALLLEIKASALPASTVMFVLTRLCLTPASYMSNSWPPGTQQGAVPIVCPQAELFQVCEVATIPAGLHLQAQVV